MSSDFSHFKIKRFADLYSFIINLVHHQKTDALYQMVGASVFFLYQLHYAKSGLLFKNNLFTFKYISLQASHAELFPGA